MLWIFPGQPLKPEPAVPDDDDFYAIKGLCRERCGFDLSHHLPLSGLTLSNHTCLQIYGVAISLYRARRLRETGITPDLIAEHSLGIYAALAAAGCLGEGDLLELVCRVGAAMAAEFTKKSTLWAVSSVCRFCCLSRWPAITGSLWPTTIPRGTSCWQGRSQVSRWPLLNVRLPGLSASVVFPAKRRCTRRFWLNYPLSSGKSLPDTASESRLCRWWNISARHD